MKFLRRKATSEVKKRSKRAIWKWFVYPFLMSLAVRVAMVDVYPYLKQQISQGTLIQSLMDFISGLFNM